MINRKTNTSTNSYKSYSIRGYDKTNNAKTTKRKSHKFRYLIALLVCMVLVLGVIYNIKGSSKTISYQAGSNSLNSVSSTHIKSTINECIGNKLSKEVIVILSQQHLWACNYQHPIFNSPVVTGYSGNPSNITPVGTYHIFNKYTNLNLTGSDDMGSWSVHVNYWMPFLFNKYGAYGLHDATWRKLNQFGHINTATKNASHGCIECPLATAKWLYHWLNIGSTITIKNN